MISSPELSAAANCRVVSVLGLLGGECDIGLVVEEKWTLWLREGELEGLGRCSPEVLGETERGEDFVSGCCGEVEKGSVMMGNRDRDRERCEQRKYITRGKSE